MKKQTELIPLFKQFIKESENGKRLKKNGERITKGTIAGYKYVLQNLIQFSTETSFELRLCEVHKMTKRELKSEKSYWKKFYKSYPHWRSFVTSAYIQQEAIQSVCNAVINIKQDVRVLLFCYKVVLQK